MPTNHLNKVRACVMSQLSRDTGLREIVEIVDAAIERVRGEAGWTEAEVVQYRTTLYKEADWYIDTIPSPAAIDPIADAYARYHDLNREFRA